MCSTATSHPKIILRCGVAVIFPFKMEASHFPSAKPDTLMTMLASSTARLDAKDHLLATTDNNMELQNYGKKITIECFAVVMGCLTFLGFASFDLELKMAASVVLV